MPASAPLTPPDWTTIESSPEFQALPPARKLSILDAWSNDVFDYNDSTQAWAGEDEVNGFLSRLALVREEINTPDPELHALLPQQVETRLTEADAKVRKGRQDALDAALKIDQLETQRAVTSFASGFAGGIGGEGGMSFDVSGDVERQEYIQSLNQEVSAITSNVGAERVRAANEALDALKGKRDAAVLDDEIVISPQLVLDPDAYEAAVAGSGASRTAKSRARARYGALREQTGELMLQSLLDASEESLGLIGSAYESVKGALGMDTRSNFQRFYDEKVAEDPETPPADIMQEWKKNNTGWFDNLSGNLKLGILRGSADIVGQFAGLGALANPTAENTDLAVAAQQVSQGYAAAGQNIGGAGLVGDVAAVTTSQLPVLLSGSLSKLGGELGALGLRGVGGLGRVAGAEGLVQRGLVGLTTKAATRNIVGGAGFAGMLGSAGAQSAGGAYASNYLNYREAALEGLLTPDDPEFFQLDASGRRDALGAIREADIRARQAAVLPSIRSGIVTAALTAMGGKTGLEAWSVAAPAVRQKARQILKATIGQSIAEIPEETLDTFINGVADKLTNDPGKRFGDIVDETIQTAIITPFATGPLAMAKASFDYFEARKHPTVERLAASAANARRAGQTLTADALDKKAAEAADAALASLQANEAAASAAPASAPSAKPAAAVVAFAGTPVGKADLTVRELTPQRDTLQARLNSIDEALTNNAAPTPEQVAEQAKASEDLRALNEKITAADTKAREEYAKLQAERSEVWQTLAFGEPNPAMIRRGQELDAMVAQFTDYAPAPELVVEEEAPAAPAPVATETAAPVAAPVEAPAPAPAEVGGRVQFGSVTGTLEQDGETQRFIVRQDDGTEVEATAEDVATMTAAPVVEPPAPAPQPHTAATYRDQLIAEEATLAARDDLSPEEQSRLVRVRGGIEALGTGPVDFLSPEAARSAVAPVPVAAEATIPAVQTPQPLPNEQRRKASDSEFEALHARYIGRNVNQVSMLADQFDEVEAWAQGRVGKPPGRWNSAQWMDLAASLESMATDAATQGIDLDGVDTLARQIRERAATLPGAPATRSVVDVRSLGAAMVPTQSDESWQMPVKTVEKFFRDTLGIDLRARPGLSSAVSRAMNAWANGDSELAALDPLLEREAQHLLDLAAVPDAAFTPDVVVRLDVADRSQDDSIIKAIIAEYIDGDRAVLPSRALVNRLFINTRPTATGTSQAPGINWGSAYGREVYERLETAYYAKYPQGSEPVARWVSGAKGPTRTAEVPVIHVPVPQGAEQAAPPSASDDARELARIEQEVTRAEQRLSKAEETDARNRATGELSTLRQRRAALQAALTAYLVARAEAANGNKHAHTLLRVADDARLTASEFTALRTLTEAPMPRRGAAGKVAGLSRAAGLRAAEITAAEKSLAKLEEKLKATLESPEFQRYQAMERTEMAASKEGRKLATKFKGPRGITAMETRLRQARAALHELRAKQDVDAAALADAKPPVLTSMAPGTANALRRLPVADNAPNKLYAVLPHARPAFFERGQVALESTVLVTSLPLAKEMAGSGMIVDVGNSDARDLSLGGAARFAIPAGYYNVGATVDGVVELERAPELGVFRVEGKFTNNPDLTAQQVSMGMQVRIPAGMDKQVNPNIHWSRKTRMVTSVTLTSPEFNRATISEPGDYLAVWEAREEHAASRNSQLVRRTLEGRRFATTLEEDRNNVQTFFNLMSVEGLPTDTQVQTYYRMVEELRARETGTVMPAEERLDYLDNLPPVPGEAERVDSWSNARWQDLIDAAFEESELTRAFVGDHNRLIRAARQRFIKKLRLGQDVSRVTPRQMMRDVVASWHKALVNHTGPVVISLQAPIGTDLGGNENTLEAHLASVARDFADSPDAAPLTLDEHDEFVRFIASGQADVTAGAHEQSAFRKTVQDLITIYPDHVRRILKASRSNEQFALDPFNGMIVWLRGSPLPAAAKAKLVSALGSIASDDVIDRVSSDPDLTLALISMHEGILGFLAEKGITPQDTSLMGLANLVNQDNRHWEVIDMIESYRDVARGYMLRQRQDFLDQHADAMIESDRQAFAAPAVRSAASLANLESELRSLEQQARRENFADRSTIQRLNDTRGLINRRMRVAMAQQPTLQEWLNNENNPVRLGIRSLFKQHGIPFTPDNTRLLEQAEDSVVKAEQRQQAQADLEASRSKAEQREDEIIARLAASSLPSTEESPFVREWKKSFADQLTFLGLDREDATVAGAIDRIAASTRYPARLRALAQVLQQPGFASLLTDLEVAVDYQPDIAAAFYTVSAPRTESDSYYRNRGRLVLNGAAMNSDVATNLLDHLVQTTVGQRLDNPVTPEQKAAAERINGVIAEITMLEDRTRVPGTSQRFELALSSPQEFVRHLWNEPSFRDFINSLETPASATVQRLRNELDAVVEQLDPEALRQRRQAIMQQLAGAEGRRAEIKKRLAVLRAASTKARNTLDKDGGNLETELAAAKERLTKAVTKDDRLAEKEIIRELEGKLKSRKPFAPPAELTQLEAEARVVDAGIASLNASLEKGGDFFEEIAGLRARRDELHQQIQDEQANFAADVEAGQVRRAAATQGILARIWKYLAELFTGVEVKFGSLLHEAFSAVGNLVSDGPAQPESFLGKLQRMLENTDLIPPMKVMDARAAGRRSLRSKAEELVNDPATSPEQLREVEARINTGGYGRAKLGSRTADPAAPADPNLVRDVRTALRPNPQVTLSEDFEDPAWVSLNPDDNQIYVNATAMARELERLPAAGRMAYLHKALEEEADHNELVRRFSETHLLAVAEGMTAKARRALMIDYLGLEESALTEADETRLSFATGDHPQMSDTTREAARINLAHEHLRRLRQLGRTGMTTEEARSYVSRLTPGHTMTFSALSDTWRKAAYRFRTFGSAEAMLADAETAAMMDTIREAYNLSMRSSIARAGQLALPQEEIPVAAPADEPDYSAENAAALDQAFNIEQAAQIRAAEVYLAQAYAARPAAASIAPKQVETPPPAVNEPVVQAELPLETVAETPLPDEVQAAVKVAAREPDLPKAKSKLKEIIKGNVKLGDLIDSESMDIKRGKVVEILPNGTLTVLDPGSGWEIEVAPGDYTIARLKLGSRGFDAAGPVTGERKNSRALAGSIARRADVASLIPGRSYWSGVRPADDAVAAAWIADTMRDTQADFQGMADALIRGTGLRFTKPQRISAIVQLSETLGALETRPVVPGEALGTATLGFLLRDTRKKLLDTLADEASDAGQVLNAFAGARNILAPWYAAKSYQDTLTNAAREALAKEPVTDALNILKGTRAQAAVNTVDNSTRIRKALVSKLSRTLNLPESAGQTLFDFMEDANALAAELAAVSGQDNWKDSQRVKELPNKLGDKIAKALASVMLGNRATPDSVDVLTSRVRAAVVAQINARIKALADASPETPPASAAIANMLADVAATSLMSETYTKALAEMAGKAVPADADPAARAKWESALAAVTGTSFDPASLASAATVLRRLLPLNDMLKMHLADQHASVANLADTIAQSSDLDDASATAVATALAAAYAVESRKLLASYREQYIKRHNVKDVDLTKKLTTGDRILQLMNLGAFSDEAFYNAAADELGLPAYDPAIVKELEEMGMAVQRMPEGSVQRNDAMQTLLARVADAVVTTHASHKDKSRYFTSSLPVAVFKSAILSGIGTQQANLIWGSVMSAMDAATTGLAYGIVNRGAGAGAAITETFRQLLWAFDPEARRVVSNEARRGFSTGRTMATSEGAQDISVLERPVRAPGGKVLEKFKWTGRVMMVMDSAVGVPAMLARQRLAARYALIAAGNKPVEVQQRLQEIFNPAQQIISDIDAQVSSEEAAGHFAMSQRPDLLKESRRNQLFEAYRSDLVAKHGDLGGRTLKEVGMEAAQMANLGMQPKGLVASFLEGLFGKANRSALGLVTTQVMPFPRSLANLMEFATNFTPGFGLARMYNVSPSSWVDLPERFRRDKVEFDSPEFWKLAIQQATGTAAIAVIGMLYMAGLKAEDEGEEPWFMIYGNTGTYAEKQQRAAIQPNWKPNSVKIGSLFFSLQDIPGLNLVMGGFAFHHDFTTETQGKNIRPAEFAGLMATGMVRAVTSRSMLQGMQSVFDLFDKGSGTTDAAPMRALGKLTLGAVGAVTNPRILRDVRHMGEGLLGGGQFHKLDEYTMSGLVNALLPFSPFADRQVNALGEDVTESWFSPATRRVVSVGVTPEHPVFSPLAAENVFVNPAAVTTTVRVPGQRQPVALSNFDADELQDTFHKHFADHMRSRLTPANVARIALMAKRRGADKAQEMFDRQFRTPAIEFAKARFMRQDYGKLKYNPFK